jgi:hypothetical protein
MQHQAAKLVTWIGIDIQDCNTGAKVLTMTDGESIYFKESNWIPTMSGQGGMVSSRERT